jgi:hypothetical protein
MKKVILEESFLLNRIRFVRDGLYKRLVLNDNEIVWIALIIALNRSDDSDIRYITDSRIIKELEKIYVATTREQHIKSIIE